MDLSSPSFELKLCLLEDIEIALKAGAHIDFADGALPPPFILAAAAEALRADKNPRWNSFYGFRWDGLCVGSGGFKGPPESGVVEIGYGVAEAWRGHGVATAAVAALVAVAQEEGLDSILAETTIENIASQRVLSKNGFRQDPSLDSPGMIWWRCDLAMPAP